MTQIDAWLSIIAEKLGITPPRRHAPIPSSTPYEPQFNIPIGIIKPVTSQTLPVSGVNSIVPEGAKTGLPINAQPAIEPFQFRPGLPIPVEAQPAPPVTPVGDIPLQASQPAIEPFQFKKGTPITVEVQPVSPQSVVGEESISQEIKTKDTEDLAFIELAITANSPILDISDGQRVEIPASTIVIDPADKVEYEAICLEGYGVSGVRMSEIGNKVEASSDACAVLVAKLVDGRRMRLVLVADGVGSTICGDLAAKVMTRYTMEHIARRIYNTPTPIENLPSTLADSVATANRYFHSIGRSTLRKALATQSGNAHGDGSMQQVAAIAEFDQQSKPGLHKGQDGTLIANDITATTLLGVIVVDNPTEPNSEVTVITLPLGDGGIEINHGVQYDGEPLTDRSYVKSAPPQIAYRANAYTPEEIGKFISIDSFNLPPGIPTAVTIHTDMLEKSLAIDGMFRTARDMVNFAKETSAVADKDFPYLMKRVTRGLGGAKGIEDDHTYIRISC